MNAREELLERIIELSKEMDTLMIGQRGFKYRAEKELSQLAIGRWVSVEERLPEFNNDRWKGVTIGAFGNVQFGSHYIGLQVGTTHWLELDMPKQPNEKGE